MRLCLALVMLIASACGSAGPGPVAGTPLTVPEMKFAVMDSAGPPVYCDPDFYPIAREGGEQQNAIAMYPTIKADTETYQAILEHEHLPSGDLTDEQKLVVYRAWKLLRVVALTQSGTTYAFDYRVQPSPTVYQLVSGTVRQDGKVTVSSQTNTTRPACPICLAASTLIATPNGSVRVTDLHVGTIVWTKAADGSRVAAPVVEVGSMEAPATHRMVDLVLADGRGLLVSPGHRTADGRHAGDLHVHDQLDGSTITKWELVPYAGGRTYDLLPAGATGFYWANGILLASTLTAPPTG
jgi:outer membrane protein assembly factor BamB